MFRSHATVPVCAVFSCPLRHSMFALTRRRRVRTKEVEATKILTTEKRTVKHRRAPGRGDYEAKPQTVPQEGPISLGDPAIRFLGSCDDSFQARCEWPLPAPSALPLVRACKLGLFSQFEWIPPLGCDSVGWSQSKTRDSNLVRWSCGERLQSLHCRQIAAAVKPPCRSSE